ncbi:hypothetical protein VN23_09320 [Janthinobacterium sp. B9-8]|nr:hypothetical protein VN23_09320 [Janthinobacterium sp. B9-8]
MGKQRKETLYFDNAPLSPTPANIKYARRLAAEIRLKITAGVFDYATYFPHSPHATSGSTAPLLFDVMDKWLQLHDVKSSTKSQYTTRINSFWKTGLKNIPIDLIRYSDILEVLNSGSWSSGKSRNNELSMIKGVFTFAVRDKIIKENPCDEIERAAYQSPRPDPFDLSEVNSILQYIGEHRPEQILNIVQFTFFTGLRTSETLALRWESIDFQKREVLIEGGNVYDEESDSTKTFESRIVKLTSKALEALNRQKAFTFLQGAHIFHDPKTNQPWAYAKITDVRNFWQITLKALGIRYRRPYNMRHTYATIGLMSGAKPGFLAKQLGHSQRMFFTVYAKWISSDDDDREMAKLEEEIKRSMAA